MAISRKNINQEITKGKSMKKTILTCLALMTIGLCLFVSCSGETAVPDDRGDVAYIKFGEDITRGSSFSASVSPAMYDNLYWFYTAKKTSGDGLTGDTGNDIAAVKSSGAGTGAAPGKGIVFSGSNECLGPFSQGEWTFTLKAYSDYKTSVTEGDSGYTATTVLYNNGENLGTIFLSDADLVYKTPDANPIKVTLYAGQTKTINALTTTVEAVGKTGTVNFDSTTAFVYKTKGTIAPTITMTAVNTTSHSDTYTFTNGITEDATADKKYALSLTNDNDYKNWTVSFKTGAKELPVGTYACTISATDKTESNVPLYDSKDSETPITQLTFYFGVYGGGTTTIKGTLNENPYSFIKFDVEEITEMQVDYSTLSSKDGLKVSDNVTLDFSAAGLDQSAISYNLRVTESKNSDAKDTFVIENGTAGVVKSYKIELTKKTTESDGTTKDEKVKDFGTDKKVTATLNVGGGLNGGNDYGTGESGAATTCSIVMHYVKSAGDTGANPTIKKYDESEGLLTMETDHFSEFVVIDTEELPFSITTEGKKTAVFADTLTNAFSKAEENQTITLLNALENKTDKTDMLGGVIETTKSVTLDLDSKVLKVGEGNYILVKKDTTLTVKKQAADQSAFVVGVAKTSDSTTTVYEPAYARSKVGTADDNATYEYHTTLKAAVEKANVTEVALVQDQTLSEAITVNSALKLNMNNCTVTAENEKKITVSGDNGLIVSGSKWNQKAFIDGIRVSSSSAVGIDGTYYSTLKAAVDGAKDGDTITLYDNITSISATIAVNKSLTIDLNGKTITADKRVFLVNKGTLTIKNGTITSEIKSASQDPDPNYIGNYVIKVDSYDGNAGLVLEKSATIKAPNSYGIVAMENQASDTTKGVYTTNARTATLDIYGTIESANPCISGNGSLSSLSVTMNVYDGAVLSQDSSNKSWTGVTNNDPVAIYQPNVGVLNIYGGTITSKNGSAVEVRAGKAYIYGGTLISEADEYKAYNGNGPSVKGAAVAVSQHTTKKALEVYIYGGTFTVGDKGKQLVVVDTLTKDMGASEKDYSTAGDRAKVKAVVASGVEMAADKIVGVKTGGSTGVDGTYYLDGEAALANGVGAGAEVGGKYYYTLQEAIDAAADGATVELLTDVCLDDNVEAEEAGITIKKSLTLDGNGHKLYNTATMKSTKPLIQIGDAAEETPTTIDANIVIKDLDVINTGSVSAEKARLIGVERIGKGSEDNNSSVTFEGVNVSSENTGSLMRGIYFYENKATFTFDKSSVSLPTYYALYISTGCDYSKLVIRKSTLNGWTSIYNIGSNFMVEAENSTFGSVNKYGGGSSNSSSDIIVSEYYLLNSGEKSENNTMTFNNCVFTASITSETSDVTQKIADLRSPCNNKLILNDCSCTPARNSQYFVSCYDSGYDTVEAGKVGTNEIWWNNEDYSCSDKVTWYYDCSDNDETISGVVVQTKAFKIQYENVEADEITGASKWYVRYCSKAEGTVVTNNNNNEVTLPTPTRTGYTFGGWYTEESLSNKKEKIVATDAQHFTLYAKWTAAAEV